MLNNNTHQNGAGLEAEIAAIEERRATPTRLFYVEYDTLHPLQPPRARMTEVHQEYVHSNNWNPTPFRQYLHDLGIQDLRDIEEKEELIFYRESAKIGTLLGEWKRQCAQNDQRRALVRAKIFPAVLTEIDEAQRTEIYEEALEQTSPGARAYFDPRVVEQWIANKNRQDLIASGAVQEYLASQGIHDLRDIVNEKKDKHGEWVSTPFYNRTAGLGALLGLWTGLVAGRKQRIELVEAGIIPALLTDIGKRRRADIYRCALKGSQQAAKEYFYPSVVGKTIAEKNVQGLLASGFVQKHFKTLGIHDLGDVVVEQTDEHGNREKTPFYSFWTGRSMVLGMQNMSMEDCRKILIEHQIVPAKLSAYSPQRRNEIYKEALEGTQQAAKEYFDPSVIGKTTAEQNIERLLKSGFVQKHFKTLGIHDLGDIVVEQTDEHGNRGRTPFYKFQKRKGMVLGMQNMSMKDCRKFVIEHQIVPAKLSAYSPQRRNEIYKEVLEGTQKAVKGYFDSELVGNKMARENISTFQRSRIGKQHREKVRALQR